jgi:hypothetical protein
MADLNEEKQSKIQPQVELDLDDANEQDVQVAEDNTPESKEPNLNVGEVDLGYTDHQNKQSEKAEIIIDDGEEKPVKVEPKQDEESLLDVSEGVQKRIDKLTRKWRESERREKAALEYAKGLQKKYDNSVKQYDTADEQYLKEFEARVDAQREQVKIKLRDAIEQNDAEKIMEANDELTRLSVEKEKARIKMADRDARLKALQEQQINQSETQPRTQEQDMVPPEPSVRARSWAQKNTWFGNDKIMTNAAFTIHEDLVGMGVDVESDEYYNEIDKRMQENFPHKFAQEQQRKPVQTVASAGRKQQGRRSVRLTKSQVAIAKKLGVPLEEYAKYVKEVQ